MRFQVINTRTGEAVMEVAPSEILAQLVPASDVRQYRLAMVEEHATFTRLDDESKLGEGAVQYINQELCAE